MSNQIAVAGATGNLGVRVTRALVGRGAEVVALARVGSEDQKIQALRDLGAKVVVVNMADLGEVSRAIAGSSCVVSAVQGLRDVIVGAQSVLLDAAVAAGVPRYIPSDFSTDFTDLPAGQNRNFDLRREFHERLEAAPIAATSIYNGAFGEILAYNIPILNFKDKVVGYWDDADWRMDFTTMDDTAAYTAAAALDPETPRALRIAGVQASPRDLQDFTAEAMGTPFALTCLGSLADLAAHNQRERAAHPEGETEIFPAWQQGQYLQSMFSTHHASLDNDRYPDLRWTPLNGMVPPRR